MKTALITEASGGTGKEYAKILAHDNYSWV